MPLECADFQLSDVQLERLNRHFSDRAAGHALEGEDPPSSVKVLFEWVPGLGRFVTAYFDGEVEGCAIEDPFDGL